MLHLLARGLVCQSVRGSSSVAAVVRWGSLLWSVVGRVGAVRLVKAWQQRKQATSEVLPGTCCVKQATAE
eukprot:2731015-Amphidinium_carterae.1